MQYAIDYGIRKETKVLPFENGTDGEVFVLKDEGDKAAFLMRLSPDDTLWVEMGSGAENFCAGAATHGTKVFRLPTKLSKEARGEDPKHLTADTLARIAREQPGSFYPLLEEEIPVVRLRIDTREYLHYQRELRGVVERRVATAAREVFLIEQPDLTFEAFRKQRLANDPTYAACLAREKGLNKSIEHAVKQLPVYEQVFRRIRGCGPVTAGLIISEIGDIRRFPKDHPERLRAYAGYAVYNGVSSVQMRAPGSSLLYQPNLQLGMWYFTQFGVAMRSQGFSGWRQLLDQRKAYLKQKFPEKARAVIETEYDTSGNQVGKPRRLAIPIDEWEQMEREEKVNGHTIKRVQRGLPLYTPAHIHAMSMRYVGEKFLNAVHRWWHTFLEGGQIPEVIEPSGRAPWLAEIQ